MVIADRGYNQADQWMDLADRGVGVVLRYNPHGLRVYAPDENPVDLEAVLQATTVADLCLPVQVRNKHRPGLNGYLHARRLPPAQAAEAGRERRRKKPVASFRPGPWPWPAGSWSGPRSRPRSSPPPR